MKQATQDVGALIDLLLDEYKRCFREPFPVAIAGLSDDELVKTLRECIKTKTAYWYPDPQSGEDY